MAKFSDLFGRKGEPTAAEVEAQRKRDERKAAGEKVAAEKAEQDRQANTNATLTG